MANSQNGWPVIPQGDARAKVFPWITGRVLDGDVWVVLNELCAQYATRVEKIDPAGSWGHTVRPIAGSQVYSNHASATAIDLNAPLHPQFRNTLSAAQQGTIRDIVRGLDGVVRWGGDYAAGNLDQMHFEINANAAAVKRVADRIRSGGATPAPPNPPTGRPATNPQDGQDTLEIDGGLGARTIARWQQVLGTPIDGQISSPKSTLIAADQAFLNAMVSPESIRDLTGSAQLVTDGVDGPRTTKVRQFYLFNTQAKHLPNLVGRSTPQMSDFDGYFGNISVRLLQLALNDAVAGSGRY